MLDSRNKHITCSNDISHCSLHWEELTRRNLFQGCCCENIVYTTHCNINRRLLTDVANVEFYLGILKHMTHIILLLLIA